MKQRSKSFPKDFLWGGSTAAHQVEGGTHNQWSVWELANAVELSKNATRANSPLATELHTLPIWKEIKNEVTDPENYVSGRGVDHYRRYKEDFDILASLNFNSFRFGVEWSRIEPEEGVWNEAAIKHYQDYIAELRKRNIEPFLNIWHWTNPVWFEEKGAFTKRANLKYFERFVKKVSETLCVNVNYVLTINEANSYMSFGYILGTWPPQQKNIVKGLTVYYNLMLAHKRAYKILKADHPDMMVGIAHQASYSVPTNPRNPIEKLGAWGSNYFWQNWFYNRCRNHQDFIGMNYYFTNYIKGFGIKNPTEPMNDLGWYMEPRSLVGLLKYTAKKYKKPIIITENGVADRHDQYRQWWIEETIAAMQEALDDGVDLRGYMHWSLLDNFEWAEGWWPKFGLVAVNRTTMKRTVRPSARRFAEEIKALSR